MSSETVDTYVLLRAFVDELQRCGLAGACTSPGSRSTPMVLTLARSGLPCWSHVDERCAAFFGLGVAKATGRPVALTCTSGTAAANYLPAVIEAREARVPLIVLTTDRPPELRDSGAGQTIDQLKLFGDAAKWFVEVGTHEATPARLRWIRQLACRAVWTALDGRPGVVHLNFPLREPLVLGDGEELPEDTSGRPDGRPLVARQRGPEDGAAAGEALLPIVRSAERGVIVCGRHERRTPLGAAAAAFAEAAGWPLLADPLSGARRGPNAVAHYDALLRVDALAAAARPDVVLRVGDLPTSKPLRTWLRESGAVTVVLDDEQAWQDPDASADLVLQGDPVVALVGALEKLEPPEAPPAPLTAWQDADARAAGALQAALGEELSEPSVAAELVGALPAEATLVVAASMPIRDVETFAPARPDGGPRVLANRGANGIDGTTSTAYGIAAGSPGPTVLLTGDVTLAHDLGGLLAATRTRLPLTIVLLDNGGGGIFDFLAVSSQTDHYEHHVATPTGLSAERIADLFGLVYAPVDSVGGLRNALDHGLALTDETMLVHVRTVRAENVALHRRCWSAVAAALQD